MRRDRILKAAPEVRAIIPTLLLALLLSGCYTSFQGSDRGGYTAPPDSTLLSEPREPTQGPQPKDPALAATYGAALLGAGHVYAGSPGTAVGLWVVGPGGFFLARHQYLEGNVGRSGLYVGVGLLGASYILSVFNAPAAALDWNREHGVRATVRPKRGPAGGNGLAVRVRF